MPIKNGNIRILWIVPKFPLGVPDGARHATCSLVRELTRRKVRLHLVCLVPDGEAAEPALVKDALGVEDCSIIRRSQSKFFPLPSFKLPFTFRTFSTRRVRRALQKQLREFLQTVKIQDAAYLVFDGLHAFAALAEDLKTLSSQCDGIVYRAHNVETVLWQQCAAKARRWWQRWFFQYQTALMGRFEEGVARRVDLIAPVTEEDAERFRRQAPETAVSVTRIGMEFPEETSVHRPGHSEALDLLFVGRLDWLPNRMGLAWFLDNVWLRLLALRPLVTLTIAGIGDGRWLEKYQRFPGIKLLGKVDHVEPLYRSCALCIAPLFQGSGMRVKILESARFRRAVLSTALGAEGSGLIAGQSYYQAETPNDWLGILAAATIEDCQRMGEEAYRAVRDDFDNQAIVGQFLESLSCAGARP